MNHRALLPLMLALALLPACQSSCSSGDFYVGECTDAPPDGGPHGGVDPDECAALGGFCEAWWFDSCPPGYELYGKWGEEGCVCCVPAPPSPCSDAIEAEHVHCMWESDCTSSMCFQDASEEYACEPCRTCCRAIGCD